MEGRSASCLSSFATDLQQLCLENSARLRLIHLVVDVVFGGKELGRSNHLLRQFELERRKSWTPDANGVNKFCRQSWVNRDVSRNMFIISISMLKFSTDSRSSIPV